MNTQIKLHIANAHQKFTPFISKLESLILDTVHKIEQEIPFLEGVDIIIAEEGMNNSTIPEDKIGGQTENSNLVNIVLAEDFSTADLAKIPEFLTHELSHALRWQYLDKYHPECLMINSLIDLAIFEGIAIKTAELICGKQSYFSSVVTNRTDQQNLTIIKQLLPIFNNSDFDYETIFFTGDKALPRWSAYSMGYFMVNKHTSHKAQGLKELLMTSYDDIKKHST